MNNIVFSQEILEKISEINYNIHILDDIRRCFNIFFNIFFIFIKRDVITLKNLSKASSEIILQKNVKKIVQFH